MSCWLRVRRRVSEWSRNALPRGYLFGFATPLERLGVLVLHCRVILRGPGFDVALWTLCRRVLLLRGQQCRRACGRLLPRLRLLGRVGLRRGLLCVLEFSDEFVLRLDALHCDQRGAVERRRHLSSRPLLPGRLLKPDALSPG